MKIKFVLPIKYVQAKQSPNPTPLWGNNYAIKGNKSITIDNTISPKDILWNKENLEEKYGIKGPHIKLANINGIGK